MSFPVIMHYQELAPKVHPPGLTWEIPHVYQTELHPDGLGHLVLPRAQNQLQSEALSGDARLN